ncbi:DUF1772 domain-containing protein [Demetria terragena]|uniref:anthrone oxygenase family protein n=1 Tax=Demetria terragena TaxID=63959 RepID=UPI00037A12BA|nr:anthrone oxygenase family protein [Demetria terragena]
MSYALGPLLLVAIVANGLLAGLFFVFSVAIGPGFGRVDDATYVRAFRAINAAILNGMFVSVFFVAPLAAVGCVLLHVWQDGSTSLPWVIAAAVCSVLTFGITTAVNVPLNRELDQAPITTDQQRQAARQRFESRWNRWNYARTATSAGALTLLATTLAVA